MEQIGKQNGMTRSRSESRLKTELQTDWKQNQNRMQPNAMIDWKSEMIRKSSSRTQGLKKTLVYNFDSDFALQNRLENATFHGEI